MDSHHRTKLSQIGLFPLGQVRAPITPAINATTFISKGIEGLAPIDAESLTSIEDDVFGGLYYGGVDTPTTLHLAAQISRLEGGQFAVLAPSGQSAITGALAAFLRPGDHFLVGDTTTYTTRWLFDQHFQSWGVQVEYFGPEDAPSIASRMRPNTKAVFWESPGAFTYEIVDVRPIVHACKDHPAITIMDNTWAASTFFRPLEHDVDLSVISLTKSHAAVSGVSLGATVTNHQNLFNAVKSTSALLGSHVSSESCSKALISMSTLGPRLLYQMSSTEAAIGALLSIDGISRVFHPSLPTNKDHKLYQRDFSGFNSLVSVEFAWPLDEVIERINRLQVVNVGYGWGGSLSLINIFDPTQWPSSRRLDIDRIYARFYFGLEDTADLTQDLKRAFQA